MRKSCFALSLALLSASLAAAEPPQPASAQSPRLAADSPKPTATDSPRPAVAKSTQPAVAESPRPAATESPRPAGAESPRPAVRLRPAQPMDAGDSMHARAADGRFDPFTAPPRREPVRQPAAVELNQMDSAERPLKKVGKWLEERVQGVKQAFAGPPPPQPEPRVGQLPSRRVWEANSPPPPPRRVNAAEPAYRWYGWGTATPGMNQYAPTGEYPQASAQWYLQTGATPGAFPVPAVNPYRPPAGAAPPTYVQPPAPQPAARAFPAMPPPQPSPGSYPNVNNPPMLSALPTPSTPPSLRTPPGVQHVHPRAAPLTIPPPQIPPPTHPALPGNPPAVQQPRVTIAETPAPGAYTAPGSSTMPGLSTMPGTSTVPGATPPRPAPVFQSIPVPPPQLPAASTPPRQPRVFIEQEPPAKPASENLIIPVIRGQEPTIDDAPLGARVREAGRGLVENVSIRESGPRQLIVSYHASTKAMAELAARAMAAIPELKPYQVEFAATIRQR